MEKGEELYKIQMENGALLVKLALKLSHLGEVKL
jgi:hypothetical protein